MTKIANIRDITPEELGEILEKHEEEYKRSKQAREFWKRQYLGTQDGRQRLAALEKKLKDIESHRANTHASRPDQVHDRIKALVHAFVNALMNVLYERRD